MQKYNVQRHSAAVELDKILKLLAEQTASEDASEQALALEPAVSTHVGARARFGNR